MQDMQRINLKLKKLSESKDKESNESSHGKSDSSTVAGSTLEHGKKSEKPNSGAQQNRFHSQFEDFNQFDHEANFWDLENI